VAQTITRSAEDNVLSQLNIDFPKVIASGNLYILAHGIEEESRPIWNKYAVNQDGKGTLTHFECDKTVLAELVQRAKSETVTNSLRYFLGSTYHNYLKSGGQIILNVDGEIIHIVPIDRLCWDTVTEKDEHHIYIYLNPNTGEVRAYFSEKYMKTAKNNARGYLTLLKGKKKHSFVKGLPPDDFILLGLVNLRCAYSENWIQLQKEVLTDMGVNVPDDNGDGIEELRRVLGGTDIERNGKLIAMFQAEKAKSGDKAAYEYIEQSRYSVRFNPVSDDNVPKDDDAYTLDDVFNVQVNKSRIDTSLIDANVWMTIQKIRRSYATYCYKRLCPQEEKSEEEEVDNNAHVQEPSAASTPTDGLSSYFLVIKKQKQVQEEEEQQQQQPQEEEQEQKPQEEEQEQKPQEEEQQEEQQEEEQQEEQQEGQQQEEQQEEEQSQEEEKPQEEEQEEQKPEEEQPQEEEQKPQEEQKPEEEQPQEEEQKPQEEQPQEEQPQEEQKPQEEQQEGQHPQEEQPQEEEKPQEEEQEQSQEKQPQQQAAAPVIRPRPSAVVDVISHPREVPKTKLDLMIQFRYLRSKYTDAEIDAVIAKASNVVEPGITAKCRVLHDIDDFMQKELSS
jgi:DNA segregation ATPase FtsK/SpoIIIE-like protein